MEVLEQGFARRQNAATESNRCSSRSHCLVCISVTAQIKVCCHFVDWLHAMVCSVLSPEFHTLISDDEILQCTHLLWHSKSLLLTSVPSRTDTLQPAASLQGEDVTSKLWLVDLAGSERLSKSHAVGERLKEAKYINRSLSALADCIAARCKNSKHVPFRNSKLTHLLQVRKLADQIAGSSFRGHSLACKVIASRNLPAVSIVLRTLLSPYK